MQYIIDSVVNELCQDPNKKFIYVETAFFWKWWLEQDDKMKEKVKELVRNGQLEFIGGAWSMNDEATTHYHSTIDQFTWGFRYLIPPTIALKTIILSESNGEIKQIFICPKTRERTTFAQVLR